jgi:hypothetical protein
MVAPHFWAIFGKAREFFGGNFENLLKIFIFILVHHGVSVGVLIQVLISETFN